MIGRLGFLIFLCGFFIDSWGMSLIGFLLYEFSHPIPFLAFVSSGTTSK